MPGRSFLLVAFAALPLACGDAGGTGEPSALSSTLSSSGEDAAAPGALDPPVHSACEADGDCAKNDLCVAHTCRPQCRSNVGCASGVCVFEKEGGCYNEHGCNPPPLNWLCPTMCYGYCSGE
jgi:hypothetical protein